MVQSYLVAAEVVPEEALAAHYTGWPASTIPLFICTLAPGQPAIRPPRWTKKPDILLTDSCSCLLFLIWV
jgi:hypothetical protein